jgi:hypothetical protein
MLIRVLLPTLALSILVYVLHVSAMELSFYWIYWWFDILLHTLTGFVVGLLAVFLAYRTKLSLSRRQAFLVSFLAVFFIAIAWEFFEYINGLAGTPGSYMLDTFMDIVVGIIGGLMGAWYVSLVRK